MSLQKPGEHAHSSHWIADQNGEWDKAGTDMIHISAKGTNITWGNDDRFWRWIELPKDELPKDLSKDESCFHSAAELNQVNWLQVTSSLDLAKYKHQLQSKIYEIIYHIKFKVDAFGLNKAPVTFQVITPDGHIEKKREIMEQHRKGGNGWHEIHGGVFKLPTEMTGKVEFGMFDVESHWWKGGMIFAGVTIRPKE